MSGDEIFELFLNRLKEKAGVAGHAAVIQLHPQQLRLILG
jgi:hypothetical protein